tara:strand:- start:623 stop:1414 length:792 start_codon:yes stop_codon:yes gene_type:complete
MDFDEFRQLPAYKQGMLADQFDMSRTVNSDGSLLRDREGERMAQEQFMLDVIGTSTPFGVLRKVDKLAKTIANLPMDEASRMKRAREMGYDTDTTWYRGADRDYKRNKQDSFYSSEPWFAEQFTYGKGGISPVHARGKIFDFKNKESVNELISKMDELNAHANANPYTDAVAYYPYRRDVVTKGIAKGDAHKIETDIAYQALKELGYDGTKVMESGVENLMMFSPSNIRSKFAKFDPKKSKSGNILAGVGGTAVALPVLSERK